ncbi:MAG: DUF4056 domain-containing protein [Phycisphaerae bacterium]|nr:DUF4056 domain-containing protein [Phycisphaerae bacterium]
MNRTLAIVTRTLCVSAAAALLLSTGGCGIGGPKARWGYTPKGTFGNANNLGKHSYGFGGSETVGIFYTLRGGSIDMDHVRGTADMSRAAYLKAYDTIVRKGDVFTVSPAFEMTTNRVELEYPPDWDSLSEEKKEEIARESAAIIGPVIGFYSTLWHEMLTWKGTRFLLIEPLHESAFSWDDLYSNAVGAKLAGEALKNGHVEARAYNAAMTQSIDEEMARLQMVSKKEAREITRSVKGEWYTGSSLIRRNMDAGFDDGMISPSIIPGYTNEPPISIPLFTLDGLKQHGIQITYTIKSVYGEGNTLKKMANVNSEVEPVVHLPIILKQIEQEAIEKYNYTIR